MIEVIFSNVPDGGTNTVNIKYVRSVQWSSFAEEGVIVDETKRVGKRRREISVNGFINKGLFLHSQSAQQQLESDLRAVGFGTISYTGISDITSVRFLSLEWEEYRGNPIAQFTIRFVTEEDNVHAHAVNKIGSLILVPENGYDEPTVKESIRAQAVGEQLVNNKARQFVIEGDFVGTTLEELNTYQAAIVAEVENKDTVVLTLSSATLAPGTYTVRTQRVEFSAPRVRDNVIARRYVIEAVTHDDYTKEPYTLGEVEQTFGGITLDVTKSVKHDVVRDKIDFSLLYTVNDETLTVSGKKYFTGWTAYTTFRDLFRPVPALTYLFSSPTGNTLELVEADVSQMQRDGNFSSDNGKRYSAEITLTFRWIKAYQDINYEFASNHFGIDWYEVQNVNFGVTVNDKGHVVSRTLSVSGSVLSATQFNDLKAKIGTKVDWDTTYNNLYLTSVTVGRVETIIAPGVGKTKIHYISISASQLNTATQAHHFLDSLFKMSKAGGAGTSYSADTILFDNVTNRTKSISNRWNGTEQKFTVTAISVSLSGDVFDNDNGSGSPQTPNKVNDLFNKIDALLNAPKSEQTSANNQPGNLALPENTDIHFMITNFNVGGWEPFVDEVNGQRRWKQSVSISATAVFDLSGNTSDTQPDTIESRSETVTLESPKYQQIQIVGFGTVFKRVGTTPEKLTVTYQKSWKNAELYRQANLSGLNFGADNIGVGTWRGSGKNVKVRDEQSNRGLTNYHTVEYNATEKLD